tara:strand:+ start:26 stop:973 length:948 start_codon:yes stop_codon:yes gene_type:complete
MQTNNFSLYSFYYFIQIKNKNNLKQQLDKYLSRQDIKGTILIADEGINASISGNKKLLEKTVSIIKKKLNVKNFAIRENSVDFHPFNRMKIRLKKEIVSLGQGKLDIKNDKDKYIDPSDWNKIISDPNVIVIDVRNSFEIKIGKFMGSNNPQTECFRDFPIRIDELKFKKDNKIAMYCTGGIRCEKASAYLNKKGFKDVVQLKGGIINYLQFINENNCDSLWEGECFVFDDRVAINNKLKQGSYIQCYGCRHPITKKDTYSKKYEKGVSCHNCFDKRNNEQKKRSRSRQSHIEKAKKDGSYNIYINGSKTEELYN